MVQLKLSPNEEARVLREEQEKRRKIRILQVREQSKLNAAKIRVAVADEREKLIKFLTDTLQDEWHKEHANDVNALEEVYTKTVQSIGEGHQKAVDEHIEEQREENEQRRQEEQERAQERHEVALERQKQENKDRITEHNKFMISRQIALDIERARSMMIASLPKPKPDPVDTVPDSLKLRPVKVTDKDAFSTSHYHIPSEAVVERQQYDEHDSISGNPIHQKAYPPASLCTILPGNLELDAKAFASSSAKTIQDIDALKQRIENERTAKARHRHKTAVEKELLKQDYAKLLHELSDLQRDDMNRRRLRVDKLPKQIFLAPHRRLDEKEEQQLEMERAFEDAYMSTTEFTGDLSLALDPHPVPDRPSVTDSLDITARSEEDTVDQSGTGGGHRSHSEPALLRQSTLNSSARREYGDKEEVGLSPGSLTERQDRNRPSEMQKQSHNAKHTGSISSLDSGTLRKLFDKIRAQRDDWIRHSVQEIPDTEDGVSDQLRFTRWDERNLEQDVDGGSCSLSEGPITIESPLSEGPLSDSDFKVAGLRATGTQGIRVAGERMRKQVNFEDEERSRVKDEQVDDDMIEQTRAIERQRRELENRLKELELRKKQLEQQDKQLSEHVEQHFMGSDKKADKIKQYQDELITRSTGDSSGAHGRYSAVLIARRELQARAARLLAEDYDYGETDDGSHGSYDKPVGSSLDTTRNVSIKAANDYSEGIRPAIAVPFAASVSSSSVFPSNSYLPSYDSLAPTLAHGSSYSRLSSDKGDPLLRSAGLPYSSDLKVPMASYTSDRLSMIPEQGETPRSSLFPDSYSGMPSRGGIDLPLYKSTFRPDGGIYDNETYDAGLMLHDRGQYHLLNPRYGGELNAGGYDSTRTVYDDVLKAGTVAYGVGSEPYNINLRPVAGSYDAGTRSYESGERLYDRPTDRGLCGTESRLYDMPVRPISGSDITGMPSIATSTGFPFVHQSKDMDSYGIRQYNPPSQYDSHPTILNFPSQHKIGQRSYSTLPVSANSSESRPPPLPSFADGFSTFPKHGDDYLHQSLHSNDSLYIPERYSGSSPRSHLTPELSTFHSNAPQQQLQVVPPYVSSGMYTSPRAEDLSDNSFRSCKSSTVGNGSLEHSTPSDDRRNLGVLSSTYPANRVADYVSPGTSNAMYLTTGVSDSLYATPDMAASFFPSASNTATSLYPSAKSSSMFPSQDLSSALYPSTSYTGLLYPSSSSAYLAPGTSAYPSMSARDSSLIPMTGISSSVYLNTSVPSTFYSSGSSTHYPAASTGSIHPTTNLSGSHFPITSPSVGLYSTPNVASSTYTPSIYQSSLYPPSVISDSNNYQPVGTYSTPDISGYPSARGLYSSTLDPSTGSRNEISQPSGLPSYTGRIPAPGYYETNVSPNFSDSTQYRPLPFPADDSFVTPPLRHPSTSSPDGPTDITRDHSVGVNGDHSRDGKSLPRMENVSGSGDGDTVHSMEAGRGGDSWDSVLRNYGAADLRNVSDFTVTPASGFMGRVSSTPQREHRASDQGSRSEDERWSEVKLGTHSEQQRAGSGAGDSALRIDRNDPTLDIRNEAGILDEPDLTLVSGVGDASIDYDPDTPVKRSCAPVRNRDDVATPAGGPSDTTGSSSLISFEGHELSAFGDSSMSPHRHAAPQTPSLQTIQEQEQDWTHRQEQDRDQTHRQVHDKDKIHRQEQDLSPRAKDEHGLMRRDPLDDVSPRGGKRALTRGRGSLLEEEDEDDDSNFPSLSTHTKDLIYDSRLEGTVSPHGSSLEGLSTEDNSLQGPASETRHRHGEEDADEGDTPSLAGYSASAEVTSIGTCTSIEDSFLARSYDPAGGAMSSRSGRSSTSNQSSLSKTLGAWKKNRGVNAANRIHPSGVAAELSSPEEKKKFEREAKERTSRELDELKKQKEEHKKPPVPKADKKTTKSPADISSGSGSASSKKKPEKK